jgi:predicted nuclease with TOPRIM domain
MDMSTCVFAVKDVGKIMNDNKELRDALDKSLKDYSLLQLKYDKLELENEDLDHDFDELENSYIELVRVYNDLRYDLSDDYNSLLDENNTLLKKVDRLKDIVNNAFGPDCTCQHTMDLKEENKELKESLYHALKENMELDNNYNSLIEDKNRKNELITKLTDRISFLEDELAKDNGDIEELELQDKIYIMGNIQIY